MDIRDISKNNTYFFEKIGTQYYTVVDLSEDFAYNDTADYLYVGAANYNSTTKSTDGNLTKDQLSIEIIQNDDNFVTSLTLKEPQNNQYYKIWCELNKNTTYQYRYCKFKLKNTHTKSVLSYTIRQGPYIDTNGYYVHIYITNTTVLTNVLYNSDYTYALYSFKFVDASKNLVEYIHVVFHQYSYADKYKSYLYTQEEVPTTQSIHYIMGLSEESISDDYSAGLAGTHGHPSPTNLPTSTTIKNDVILFTYTDNINYKDNYGMHIGYTMFPHLRYKSTTWTITPEKLYLYRDSYFPDIKDFTITAHHYDSGETTGYEIVLAIS